MQGLFGGLLVYVRKLLFLVGGFGARGWECVHGDLLVGPVFQECLAVVGVVSGNHTVEWCVGDGVGHGQQMGVDKPMCVVLRIVLHRSLEDEHRHLVGLRVLVKGVEGFGLEKVGEGACCGTDGGCVEIVWRVLVEVKVVVWCLSGNVRYAHVHCLCLCGSSAT